MSQVLDRLNVLVGEWGLVGSHRALAGPVRGRVTCSWLEGAGLLVLRSQFENPEVPDGVAVIGADDTTGGYTYVYSDVRDVQRVYQMSLDGRVWQMWRDVPAFAQRFTGTFSDDGLTIDGVFELCTDGSTWDEDLKLTYTKVS